MSGSKEYGYSFFVIRDLVKRTKRSLKTPFLKKYRRNVGTTAPSIKPFREGGFCGIRTGSVRLFMPIRSCCAATLQNVPLQPFSSWTRRRPNGNPTRITLPIRKSLRSCLTDCLPGFQNPPEPDILTTSIRPQTACFHCAENRLKSGEPVRFCGRAAGEIVSARTSADWSKRVENFQYLDGKGFYMADWFFETVELE